LTTGLTTAGGPLSSQVVKFTGRADLHGVALDRFNPALELQKLRTREWTGSSRRQASAKNVGDFDEFDVLAQRTDFSGVSTDIFSGAQQFRVGITDVLGPDNPGPDLGQQGVSNETKLNNGTVGRGVSEIFFHYEDFTAPSEEGNFSLVLHFDVSNR
jgi:hypothetical protein